MRSGPSPDRNALPPLQVFLCHASGDKPAVRRLCVKLRTDGFRPWLDDEELLPGQDWQREIPNRVSDSDVVIVCLACQSVIKTGYVQKEIRHALDVADAQPEGEIFLIPLRLEPCEVPQRLTRWQWVDLFEAHGYDKLLRALETRSKSLARWAALRRTQREGVGVASRRLLDPLPPKSTSRHMTRADLYELGYIAPISTVPSILQNGILSHQRADIIAHESIGLQGIQDLRATKVIPGGCALHEYANLYISPRNPMMLKRRELHEQTCVLRISASVIDIPGALITDSNAASKYATFRPAPDGLAIVDRDRTFAESWTHDDQIEQWRHSAQKCAEVLVPDMVPASYISGAFVSCDASRAHLRHLAPGLQITLDPHLFFL